MDSPLPTLNAILNATAGVLLCVGFGFVRAGRVRAHAAAMIAATAVSAAFLVSYLVYHFVVVPEIGHTTFHRAGGWRVAYYVLLITHVVLAAVNLPMVLTTLYRAYRRDFERHRKLARWTLPIWLYVSVTGVLVYLALYPWNPAPG